MKKSSLDSFLVSALISKSLLNELTTEEEVQFEQWLQESDANRKLFESYKNDDTLRSDLHVFNSLNSDAGWASIKRKIEVNSKTEVVDMKANSKFSFWLYKHRIVSSAAVLCLIALAALLTFPLNSDPGIIKDTSGQYKNDILPGKDRAQLILSSGEVIDLEENIDRLSEKDGTLIKSIGGKLNYFTKSNKRNSEESIYNTLLVPKGGTYQITLPDGTQVWLNSESELRFPVSFTGDIRNVSLKGEAFFEVEKNASQPFVVEANGVKVQVLGTQFNVNTYRSNIETTLLEGSVKLSTSKGSSTILKPGQLGSVDNNEIEVSKADLRKMLAWKNGEFYFKGDRFSDILNQVALWYDLDVELEKSMADISITGSISKDVKLSEVLSMLKYITHGQFELNGRKLTVKKI